jgi:hypothetical protein
MLGKILIYSVMLENVIEDKFFMWAEIPFRAMYYGVFLKNLDLMKLYYSEVVIHLALSLLLVSLFMILKTLVTKLHFRLFLS